MTTGEARIIANDKWAQKAKKHCVGIRVNVPMNKTWRQRFILPRDSIWFVRPNVTSGHSLLSLHCMNNFWIWWSTKHTAPSMLMRKGFAFARWRINKKIHKTCFEIILIPSTFRHWVDTFAWSFQHTKMRLYRHGLELRLLECFRFVK